MDTPIRAHALKVSVRQTGSTSNAASETTSWVYNLANELTATTNPENETTSYTYNPTGNLDTVTDPLGRVTSYSYDTVNRQNAVTVPSGDTGSTVFNQAGEPVTSTTPAGYTTTYTYDLRGLLETVADALGNTTTHSYDPAGRQSGVTDPRGNTTAFAYDAAGRLETETDPLGGTVTFGYDQAGQRITVTDANNATRTFDYDDGGRLITATDALNRATSYSYDTVGRQTSMTDGRGITVTASYDAAGQLQTRVSPNETQTFVYDPVGRVTGFTDNTGTTATVYDQAGRIESVTTPAGVVSYGYNDAGEQVSMTQPDGGLSYAYDLNGNMSALTDWRTSTVNYLNDADGRTLTIERSNGVDTTNTYDPAGRLTGIDHAGPTGPIDNYTYTLDPNSNRIGVTSPAGAETYVVDELNRLTYAAYADATTETFSYDPQGNRTRHTRTDGTTITYTVDAAGQLVSDSDGVTYTYDQAGNLTATSSGDTYTWDDHGRLAGATVEAVTQTYGYDADGIRSLVDGQPQLWDRNRGLPVLIADDTTSYIHDNQGLLRTGNDWALTDAVGSIRTTTDNTGTTAGSASFTAFGELQSGDDLFGFAGEQQDPTELVHLRARQYNPALGRFLTTDPIQPGAPGTTGWNHYTYAAANPTTWTDPTGTSVLLEYGAGVADSADSTDVIATAVSNCAQAGLVAGIGAFQGADLGEDPGARVVEECAHGSARSYGNGAIFFGVGKLSDSALRSIRQGSPTPRTRDEIEGKAQEYAATATSQGGEGTVTAIAIDARNGSIYGGLSNNGRPRTDLRTDVRGHLEGVDDTLETWRVDNCGEVGACHAALEAGARFEDLYFYAVYTDTGKYREMCKQCAQWLREIEL